MRHPSRPVSCVIADGPKSDAPATAADASAAVAGAATPAASAAAASAAAASADGGRRPGTGRLSQIAPGRTSGRPSAGGERAPHGLARRRELRREALQQRRPAGVLPDRPADGVDAGLEVALLREAQAGPEQ